MKKILASETSALKKFRKYLKLLARPEYDDAMASWVSYRDGTANFWYDPAKDGYVLVIQNEDEYDPETYIYNHPIYWGDEELKDVNDEVLTADELVREIQALPGPDFTNYYGLRAIFDEHPELRY